MGLFSGGKEGERKEEPEPFIIEWVVQDESNRIAQLSVNREHPLSDKSNDIFKDMIAPGLRKITDGGNIILSIAPTYIDPGNGEVMGFVVVAQPTPSVK